MKQEYIIHFNTRLKKTDTNELSRNNYCNPTNKIEYARKKKIKFAKQYFQENNELPLFCSEYYVNIPNEIFKDDEHYTDEYVENHYKDCMMNFDLNMKYFERLSKEEFEKHLSRFIKKARLKQVFDLGQLKGISGIYVLVLDKFKQIYIGKSDDIKNRVLVHWRRKKEFDRLIYGRVEDSILSIDSFGALDTTRIYYKKAYWSEQNELEERLVESFPPEYRLNRCAGGINGEWDSLLRALKLIGSREKREFDKIFSEN